MSPNRYAFIASDSTVVQVIEGDLTQDQLALFLRDYSKIFGAESFVVVGVGQVVWIGGSYDSAIGEFSPPPSQEPEPEPIVEETTNDDAPIE